MQFLHNVSYLISTAAAHLLSVVAATEASIHTLEASSPLIKGAVDLALKEVDAIPAIAELEQIGVAVLAVAKLVAGASASAIADPSKLQKTQTMVTTAVQA